VYISFSQHQCHWLVDFQSNLCSSNIMDFIIDHLSNEIVEVIQTHPSYHVDFVYNIALVIGSTIFINVNPQFLVRLKVYSDCKSLFDLPKNFTVLSHSEQTPAVTTQPQ